MPKAKIEITEMDVAILFGVVRSQTLIEIAKTLGPNRKISYVQYRLTRLEELGYVSSIAGKSRSRFLTDKGKTMVGQYNPKINDWRLEEAKGQQ